GRVGHWEWGIGSGALGVGHWEWGIGSGALGVGHWQWGIGSGALAVGHWEWGIGSGALGVGHWQWGIGSGALAVGHWEWEWVRGVVGASALLHLNAPCIDAADLVPALHHCSPFRSISIDYPEYPRSPHYPHYRHLPVSPITPFTPSPRPPHRPVPPIAPSPRHLHGPFLPIIILIPIPMHLGGVRAVRALVQLQEAWGGAWAGNSNATTACSAWAGVTCSPNGAAFTMDPPPTGTIPAAITDLVALQYLSVCAARSLSLSLSLSSRLHHRAFFPSFAHPIPPFKFLPFNSSLCAAAPIQCIVLPASTTPFRTSFANSLDLTISPFPPSLPLLPPLSHFSLPAHPLL
ncbi:unnamed protein product, partial [Closterium sp. Naga37s-1]